MALITIQKNAKTGLLQSSRDLLILQLNVFGRERCLKLTTVIHSQFNVFQPGLKLINAILKRQQLVQTDLGPVLLV